MQTIYLISCVKSKRKDVNECRAEEMYTSTLFDAAFRYAQNRVSDKENQIYILSAKYGLLALSDVISPYEMTLNTLSPSECDEWGQSVFEQMKRRFDIDNTKFVFLAGRAYIDPLLKYLPCKNCSNPLERMPMGIRVKWLLHNALPDGSESATIHAQDKPLIGKFPAPKRENFETALENLLSKARLEGGSDITITSGELHRMVGGYPGSHHRMATCCEVMYAFLKKGSGGKIISAPPSGKGASLSILYYLCTDSKHEESLFPSVSDLSASLTSDDSLCLKLHRLFNEMPRLHWNEINTIPYSSGIYIVFEDGETYHDMDRIVRVGTHRSDGRLRGRLKDHFMKENKDGSIFRKNIGKAILSKNKHSYLNIWNLDSSRRGMITAVEGYDPELQRKIEKTVSNYMREHFTFVCFPVLSKQERLRLEEGIIATLNMTKDFVAGPTWRGKYNPHNEIIQSGMWLKQGLSGVPLTEKDFANIEAYCLSVSDLNGR